VNRDASGEGQLNNNKKTTTTKNKKQKQKNEIALSHLPCIYNSNYFKTDFSKIHAHKAHVVIIV